MTAANRSPWQRLLKIPTAVLGLAVIAAICLVALLSAFGVELTPFAYDQTSSDYLAAPSWLHPMGTDELGRDLLARIIYGARLSIAIGLTTALTAFLIGSVYGAIAGFSSPKVDALMMRGVDIAYSLPDLLVMILIGVVMGRGTFGILIALGLVSWMGTARLVRSQFLTLKNEEFIEAAYAQGQSNLNVILKHLLPNALGPIIVALTFTVPSAILSESTLSFIGLGLSPPACSWGTLASDGWRSLRAHPHLIFFPSLFIFITVLSFNFLGDGLRDALDPRTRLGKGK
ncbi:MAG: ABC transporter permease [Candidatus Melainabacteria bacterium]|jgi:oligopeptide transport system permease protein|uniref:ABC transporter permease n=1 Tax=Candidatus Obscuribacter phosphatis TaxID=1906157 RepID=A0A8J7PJV0_9BACT|nr:ABC transporter permease [Candidatus Obscuribacter phosphatis]MCA0314909.1 ABC transporter permease [Candidatus Melainabacteria bacterium]OPZ87033.1 MAG: Oligopeptide transport system permease protein OppC [bacterium ADurb.Bin425]